MQYFYKDKRSDFYHSQIIDNPLFWIIGCLIISICSFYANFKGFKLDGLTLEVAVVSSIIVLIIGSYQLYQVKRHLGKISRLGSYLLNYDVVEALQTSILNSRSAVAMRNMSYRVLPKIWLWYDDKAFHIKIQKLAGSYQEDLDHLAELVSSTLGDRYYVASKMVARNESWFEFVCPLLDEKIQFVPSGVADLIGDNPYHFKLTNDLVLKMETLPGVAIYGATGSRKTTTMIAILMQVLGSFGYCPPAECYFLDGKNEFSVMADFLGKDHFAVNENEVFDLLQRLLTIMDERKVQLAKAVQEQGKMGLTAYDLKLKPIYLFVDEYASVKARCSKPKKLDDLLLQCLMQFRSLGMYVIYSSQSPSTTVLSNQMREAFGTYILLASANADTQRMAFGQVATTGSVPVGAGYYWSKVASMPTPQYFVVPDLHKSNIERLEAIKWLYDNGKKHSND